MTRKSDDRKDGRKAPPTPANDADRIAKVMARAGLLLAPRCRGVDRGGARRRQWRHHLVAGRQT